MYDSITQPCSNLEMDEADVEAEEPCLQDSVDTATAGWAFDP
jgi:hypothetical protein